MLSSTPDDRKFCTSSMSDDTSSYFLNTSENIIIITCKHYNVCQLTGHFNMLICSLHTI